MVVVSDTSPLNYLVLIGHADVLPQLFGRVLTVPAVVAELSHPGSPQIVRQWVSAKPAWLEVRPPSSLEPSLRLGRGETEAISLAHEIHADVVLIDERKGTQAAEGLGLVVTGTLGVLQLADEKGVLKLAEAIAELRLTTFRCTDSVVERLLRDADRWRGEKH
ncbi:MAG: DUF3368 domain-containing protein [Phycisphaerales bacterium]|jgi:predicted nucleic acid-binding protein